VVPPPGARRGSSAEDLIASQVDLAADVVRSLGMPVWPAGRYKADELLATGAARYAADPSVEQAVICSIDNDFNQCVRGARVVVLDRIRRVVTDEAAVVERYGVGPDLLPDLFALVGDRSDGLPGVPGWGVTSAAAVLRAHGNLDAIPVDERDWQARVRGAARLAAALAERRDEALLCRDLARLRTDLPLRHTTADLEWRGAHAARMASLCLVLGDDSAMARIERWSDDAPPC
jgi:5'-3' exonuclease